MLGHDAPVTAPHGDAEALVQTGEGLGHGELHGVVVHLLHLVDVHVGVRVSADVVVLLNHVEGELHIFRVQVFTIRPLDALADLHGPLGEVLVGLGGLHHFAVLAALGGLHLPQMGAHQLMNAEAGAGAGHVGVELAGAVGGALALNDQGVLAGSAHLGGDASGRLVAGAGLAGLSAGLASLAGTLVASGAAGTSLAAAALAAGVGIAAAGAEHHSEQHRDCQQKGNASLLHSDCLLK